MTGTNALVFLKVLCDLEKQKIEAVPQKDVAVESSFVKIYMQEKYGVGGSQGSKRYLCHKCSCLFRRKRHLRQHLHFNCNHKCLGCSECYAHIYRSFQKATGENPDLSKTFKCSSCQLSFFTQAGLAVHVESHPELNTVLDCKSCSKQFINRLELDRHQKTHMTSKIYKCDICSKAFSTCSNLTKHKRIVHKKKKGNSGKNIGDHFLAGFYNNSDGDDENPDGEDHSDSDSEAFVDTNSNVCGVCKKRFKTANLNKLHVCSKFPHDEIFSEETFGDNFQCPACSQIYCSFVALKMHIGIHRGVDPLTCTVCKKTYSKLRKMDYHYEVHGRNTCTDCGVYFYTKVSLLLHHCGYTQRCMECLEVFPTKTAYKRHLEVHPAPKNYVYKCLECKKSFLKESYFRAHQIKHTGIQPFSCSLCDSKFLMYGPFKKHVLNHISPIARTLKCKLCDKTFSTLYRLQVHSQTHVSKVDNSLYCKQCQSHFKTESALKEHISTCKDENTNENPDITTSGFECQFCSKVFSKQHQLFLHLEDTHGHKAPYLFHCDLCSRGFYHKMHLNCHRNFCSQRNIEKRKEMLDKIEWSKQTKPSERRFECSECGKKYFTQQHLDDHKYVHRDPSECPYQCKICGIGYAREYYLKLHVEKCKESAPKKNKNSLKCKVCGALFQTEKTYNRHSKVHGKEWKCTLCGEKFMTKRGFNKHEKLCTPEKAVFKIFRKPTKAPRIYTCPTCERTFILQDRYEAHVAKHEGILRFQCEFCHQKFMSVNNFKRHKCKFATKSEPGVSES